VDRLRSTINASVYLSVVLGVVLLPQLYGLVPYWLFLSVLVGWLAYLIVAVLVAKGKQSVYPLVFVLAALTLVVSLPQPQHYSYVEAGLSLASATFLVGSILQIVLIVLVPVYLYRRRKRGS